MTDQAHLVDWIPGRFVNHPVKYVLSIATFILIIPIPVGGASPPCFTKLSQDWYDLTSYLCRPTLLFSRLPPQTNYLRIDLSQFLVVKL